MFTNNLRVRGVLGKISTLLRRVKPYVPYVIAGLGGFPLAIVTSENKTVKFGVLELSERSARTQLFLRISSRKGFHILPGTKLQTEAKKFLSEIRIYKKDGSFGNLKDLMDVLSNMVITQGDLVVITFEGKDALEAREAIKLEIEKLAKLPEPEVWTFLSLEELEKQMENSPSALESIPKVPLAPSKEESLPSDFLRGCAGNCGRIVKGKVLVIRDKRAVEGLGVIPKTEGEAEKFREAIAAVSSRLEQFMEENSCGPESAVARNLVLLQVFSGKVLEIIKGERCSALSAVERFVERFCIENSLGQDFKAVVEDVLSVRYEGIDKVLAQLEGDKSERVILVLPTLTPLIALRIVENRSKISGVVVEDKINPESHQVILLDDSGIPVVTGLPQITKKLNDGDRIIVDSYKSIVILNPFSEEVLEYFKERFYEQRVFEKMVQIPASGKVSTLDGKEISLLVNVEVNDELLGTDFPGVGLRRSEFALIKSSKGLLRETEPSFWEMVEDYAQMLRICQGKPAILRTFDFEPTKLPKYLDKNLIFQALEFGPEIYLAYDGTAKTIKFEILNYLFRKQIRAFLFAAGIVAQELKGNIAPGLMFPMVSGAKRFHQIIQVIQEEKAKLKKQNDPLFEGTRIGVMIELPSAALDAENLASLADFLSIGTNDLKAATFAQLGERDALQNPNIIEGLPPLVLRYVKLSAEAAQKYNKPVSCCGALASSLPYIPLLIGAGVDHLSVAIAQMKKVAFFVQNITLLDSQNLVSEVLSLGTAQEVDRVLSRRLKDLVASRWFGLSPISNLIFNE